MELWVEGSRACQACGCTVTDPLRGVHEEFHARVEPGDPSEDVPAEPEGP